jgi:hypothetical protein
MAITKDLRQKVMISLRFNDPQPVIANNLQYWCASSLEYQAADARLQYLVTYLNE